jgi:phosphohistidine phosphatase
MTIYLLRHGIAETAAPGGDDAARALTDEGRRKLRAVLKLAREAGVKPSRILTSPLVRAVQTAELAGECLGCGARPVRTGALEPSGDPGQVWRAIRSHQDAASLLLAGHEPLFSQLAAYLLGAPEALIDFKKGALVAIEVDPALPRPRGVLRWMLTPKLAGGMD